MTQIRLDKFLADAGIGSRNQVKHQIKQGLVSVNRTPAKSGDQKIAPETDRVQVGDMVIEYRPYVYYMLNKPAGCVSASKDPTCDTVLSYLPPPVRPDLFPVGRLDKDAEGLLLITNDGPLAHRLLSPKRHVEKQYYVEVDSEIPSNAVRLFTEGMDIGEKHPTLPAVLECLSPTTAYVTIHEGKFHQIKRMFLAVGCTVTYLKRLRMGPLILDASLPPGGSRALRQEEIDALLQ